MKKTSRDFLSLSDFSSVELKNLLLRAAFLKKARQKKRYAKTLKDKSVVLIFEKPSTRTKVSFELAVKELGGHTVILENGSSQLGRGESYSDTGHVLSRYAHAIVMRTFAQKNLEEIAEAASIPVINALSDEGHPCQVMADLLTIMEKKDKKLKMKVAYIGDGNNMANTWIEAALIFGFPLHIATPKGYEPSASLLKKAGNRVLFTYDPEQAMRGVDVVNTDTWFSMGQEVSDEKRRLFEPFQVNARLLAKADPKAILLHCLPAHRGEEVTGDVLDGSQSVIWDEAENRLHVQKAILEKCVG